MIALSTKTNRFFESFADGIESVIRAYILSQKEVLVEGKDENGSAALILASTKGHIHMVLFLLAAKVKVNFRNKIGSTALMKAIESGHWDIVLILIGAGAHTNISNKRGKTPLTMAVGRDQLDIVRVLLRFGSDRVTEKKPSDLLKCTSTAVYHKTLSNLSPCTLYDSVQNEALVLACRRGCKEVVQALLSAGADVNGRDRTGDTPLIAAVENNCKDVVVLLLAAQADVKLTTEWGDTALLYSVRYDRKDILPFLLDAGSDINAENRDGESALGLAAKNHLFDIADMLLKATTEIQDIKEIETNDESQPAAAPEPLECSTDLEDWTSSGATTHLERVDSCQTIDKFLDRSISTRNWTSSGATTHLESVDSCQTIDTFLDRSISASDVDDDVLNSPKSITSRSHDIQFRDIEIGKPVVNGVFGKVSKGNWLSRRSSAVALKFPVLHPSEADFGSTDFKEFITHKHIVRIYGFCYSNSFIVMEYVSGGTLFNLLTSESELEWPKRIKIAIQITEALQYLHNKHHIHSNINSRNILLGANFHVKLNVSTSSLLHQDPPIYRCSVCWMAPELFSQGAVCTTASDIFSLGVTLWELASRKKPFEETLFHAVPYLIVNSKREDIPDDSPADFASLIGECWHGIPEERLKAQDVLDRLNISLSTWSDVLKPEIGKNSDLWSKLKCYIPSPKKALKHASWKRDFRSSKNADDVEKSKAIDYIDEERQEVIAGGLFGQLVRGTWKGTEVVAKEILFGQNVDESVQMLDFVEIEVLRLKNLRHSNLISVHGFSESPKFCIVMEYVCGGTLSELLVNQTIELSWKQRIHIASDITKGLMYLHLNGIVHGGVTSSNVLVDHQSMTAKLSGFSINKFKPFIQHTLPLCHSEIKPIVWMAPELLSRYSVCTKSSDVYSLGVTFWEISCRKIPFEKLSMSEVIQNISEQKMESICESCPDLLRSMIRHCCNPDPKHRPDAFTVYHLWLDDNIRNKFDLGIPPEERGLLRESEVFSILGEIPEEIGQGSFGVVCRGHMGNMEVAVKMFSKKLTELARKEFTSEVQIMQKLTHPNIVRFLGYCYEPGLGLYCIVMEHLSLGSLHDFLRKEKKEGIPWNRRILIAKDIALGLMYLHMNNIVHRDIKGENVLLDGNLKACLSDFGLSRVKNETKQVTTKSSQDVGTVPWMAPELHVMYAIYNKVSDIYSLAVTFWELSSPGSIPFQDSAVNVHAIPHLVLKGEREVIPESCPEKFAAIITSCWDDDSNIRPDIRKVVEMLTEL